MATSYDALFELLIQETNEQSEEFSEVVNYVSNEQLDTSIYELIAQVSQKEIQYLTYSHV